MTCFVACDEVMNWAASYDGPKFHALLSDPPYELGFMGKDWDKSGIAFNADTWRALAAHLLPGAFGMAFASTRGYHRMACAIEDAGLIIHPAIGWAFGSGFPKATKIDTQIDKAAGASRETVGVKRAGISRNGRTDEQGGIFVGGLPEECKRVDITAPATPLARAWAGHRYGLQALKPAFEFVCVFQKPYDGGAVDCITETGAGALAIDNSRILTGQRPCVSIDSERILTWEKELSLCSSCANLVEENRKHTAQATKGCSVQNNAGQTKKEKGKARRANTSRADTGCYRGQSQAEQSEALTESLFSSTVISGRKKTDLSQMDLSSITSMETRKTTESKICHLCGAALTPGTIYTRVATLKVGEDTDKSQSQKRDMQKWSGSAESAGRWPSNLILSHSPDCQQDGDAWRCSDGCAVKAMGEQSGEAGGGFGIRGIGKANCYGNGRGLYYRKNGEAETGQVVGFGDTGTAARFFYNADYTLERLENSDPFYYAAKASRAEREAGLSDKTPNRHPAIKPLKLTKHLATLLLPPPEYSPRRLLVPFAGVASEMIGAMLAGWDEVTGIEMDAEYCEIGRARVKHWASVPIQKELFEVKK